MSEYDLFVYICMDTVKKKIFNTEIETLLMHLQHPVGDLNTAVEQCSLKFVATNKNL